MRIKAIPAEVAEFAMDNPWLIAGVVVVGVGGFVYLRSNVAIAPDADVATSAAQPSYGSYGLAPLSTGGIVSSIGGGTNGIADSVVNSAALQSNANAQWEKEFALKTSLFDFEVKKSDQANALAWGQLNANLAIAAVNADIAYAGIQASNYQTSSALAQSFLMSGKSIAMGSVAGPDGKTSSFAFTAYRPDGNKSSIETYRYFDALKSTGFGAFLDKLATPASAPSPTPSYNPSKVISNAPQSGIGNGTATSSTGVASSPALQSGGSALAASVNASSGYDRGYSPIAKQVRRDANDYA